MARKSRSHESIDPSSEGFWNQSFQTPCDIDQNKFHKRKTNTLQRSYRDCISNLVRSSTATIEEYVKKFGDKFITYSEVTMKVDVEVPGDKLRVCVPFMNMNHEHHW